MSSILLIGDIHLTSKHTDEYRWGLFDWICKTIDERSDINYIVYSGDYTNEKDRHDHQLVNRFVDELLKVSFKVKHSYLLRGNHDYIADPNIPFFRFINAIPNLTFILQPLKVELCGYNIYLLPNSKTPTDDWDKLDLNNTDYCICHQTFDGALAENGQKLPGINQHYFDKYEKLTVLAGDVHQPQILGNNKIIYVGTPYHVRFNDSFVPRVLLLEENKKLTELHFETVSRYTLYINSPKELEDAVLHPNDQIKVRLSLEDPLAWEESKEKIVEICKQKQVFLHQVELLKSQSKTETVKESLIKKMSNQEVVNTYALKAKIDPSYLGFGLKILEGLK